MMKKKKNQRGIALIFSLGILGLMVVLGLTFASLSFTDQTAARSSTERYAAKVLAKSAVNRAISVLEHNTDAKVKDIISGGEEDGNEKHYDFLWRLITKHGDVAGADKMYRHIGSRVMNGNDSPYWQYVLAPNKDGNDEIVGRFAYIAYKPMGLIDPVSSAKTEHETTADAPVRYGLSIDELDLSVLAGVAVDGYALSDGDIKALGEYNQDNPTISLNTPADLFARFEGSTNTNLTTNGAYAALRDKLTSSWFSVPRSSAQKEKFAYGGKDYHRFNLNRTPEEWAALSVDDLISDTNIAEYDKEWQDFDSSLEVFDDEDERRQAANITKSIPWFFCDSDDHDKKQMAANFLAYFSPMPKDSGELNDRKYWDSLDDPNYTANMRTPYLNEVVMDIKVDMVATSLYITGGGPQATRPTEPDLAYKREVSVTLTPKIDYYVELADLYGSMGDISNIRFEAVGDILTIHPSANPTGETDGGGAAKFSYNATQLDLKSESSGGNYSVSFHSGDSGITKDGSGTFPYYYDFSYTSPSSLTLTMSLDLVNDEFGEVLTGGTITYTEPLDKLIVKALKFRLSSDFNTGSSGFLPIDFSNLSADDKEFSAPFDGAGIDPFSLTVSGGSDLSAPAQTRRIVLRYQAKDAAANLNAEDWQVSEGKYDSDSASITDQTGNLGKINWFNGNKPDVADLPDDFSTDNKADYEHLAGVESEVEGYGGKVSTSYIRGCWDPDGSKTKKIQSPWEIGFIHRGKPFQTLNIKKYNKNSDLAGNYEDGDANIFDFVKITPDDPAEEDLKEIRGQINLNDISADVDEGVTIDSGNLQAVRTLFSNIRTGWALPGTDDEFDTAGGTVLDPDNHVNEIVIALAELNQKQDRFEKRSQLLYPGDSSGDEKEKRAAALYEKLIAENGTTGKYDAALEELPGKFLMLTSAESMADQPGDFLIITGIAQSIKMNHSTVADKDWLQNGTFGELDLADYSSGAANAPQYERAMIEAGYGYRSIRKTGSNYKADFIRFMKLPKVKVPEASDRLKTFYSGYDQILATQKVVAWLRRNASGKWYIERLDYVD